MPLGATAIAIVCALLSGAGFYFSVVPTELWPLAWLTPVPVLWLAFGKTNGWAVFAASWAAGAIGYLSVLPAYAGSLPAIALAMGFIGPGLYFAASVMGARLIARRVSPLTGVLAFAALWTACDYLVSLGANGTAPSPAYSQVGAPFLILGASVFGIWIVTFLLGVVPAGLAMSLQRRSATPAILALALFSANAAFGDWRIAHAFEGTAVRIGLGADDSVSDSGERNDQQTALGVVLRYARVTHALSTQGASLIVFPEKVAVLSAPWRETAIGIMRSAARNAHATIVIGFDDHEYKRRNAALIFAPDGSSPAGYFKRHMVPGLEDVFVPGDGGFVQPDRTGVAICKDMDFPATLRSDSVRGRPTLLAVPAWDFDQDRYWHAHLAIMRGVEDGFSLARAAKNGLLTLSDAYGRVIAMKRSDVRGMVTLVGDLRRGPGDTFYLRFGDAFAWVCMALSAGLLALAFVRRGIQPSP
jgi:apolipoprotein N-acyltransferase